MSPLSAAMIDRYGWRDTYVDVRVRRRGGTARLRPARRPTARRRLAATVAVRRCAGAAPCSVASTCRRSRSGSRCSCRSCSSASTRRSGASTPVQAAVLVGVLGGSSVLSRVGFGSLVRTVRFVPAVPGLLRHPRRQLPGLVGRRFVVRGARALRARARRRLRRVRGAQPDPDLRPDGRRRARLDPRRAVHRARARRPARAACSRLVDRPHRLVPVGDRRAVSISIVVRRWRC